MSLSKYIKYTSIGIVGCVAGAEIIYHRSQNLRNTQKSDFGTDINEIIFTGSNGNYKSKLVKDIVFVCGPRNFAVEVLLNIILSARHSIHIAIQVFTSNLLAWALIAAKRNGVDVKCVVDSTMDTDKKSKIKMLAAVGIPVKIHEEKQMNLKLCVIDVPNGVTKPTKNNLEPSVSIPANGIIITGVLNWTREALLGHEENSLVVTSKAEMCNNSALKFRKVWENSRLY